MKRRRTYRVKDVAGLAGVSVRTLHYYDAIGLLTPSGRSPAGYRLYEDGDLLRLQQILIGRALGLALEEIRRSLDDPAFDRRAALISQREQLQARGRETARMIAAIDRAITALDHPTGANDVDLKDIFDGFDPSQYEAEAKARWGETDFYKQSAHRTAHYTASDWQAIKAEQAAIYADAATLMRAGAEPGGKEAMEVAERHRLSIDRWFYPVGPEMHARLADLWESDARFAETIDKHAAGLTQFLAAAVRANAARSGK
jgi:DNA-binding transcriptional MerR regulator